MCKAVEYRQVAKELRALAERLKGGTREKLLQIAEDWEKLARDSERRVAYQPGSSGLLH